MPASLDAAAASLKGVRIRFPCGACLPESKSRWQCHQLHKVKHEDLQRLRERPTHRMLVQQSRRQAWGSQDRTYTAISTKRHNRKLVAQRSPFDAVGGSACSSRLIELTEPLEGLSLSMPSLCSSPLFSSGQFSSPVIASSRFWCVRRLATCRIKGRVAQLVSFLQRKATQKSH